MVNVSPYERPAVDYHHQCEGAENGMMFSSCLSRCLSLLTYCHCYYCNLYYFIYCCDVSCYPLFLYSCPVLMFYYHPPFFVLLYCVCSTLFAQAQRVFPPIKFQQSDWFGVSCERAMYLQSINLCTPPVDDDSCTSQSK